MIGALVGKLFDAALLAIERSAKPLTVRSRPVLSNASLNVRPPLNARLLKDVVPVVVCLRNVPLLTNAPAEPLSANVASTSVTNVPPLAMLPPLCRNSAPLPVNVTIAVPVVDSVRLLRKRPDALLIVIVAPELSAVVPPPCIVPALQSAVLVSDSVAVPSRMPPDITNCGTETLLVTLSVPPVSESVPAPLTVVPAPRVKVLELTRKNALPAIEIGAFDVPAARSSVPVRTSSEPAL